jgi:hypothetical protein
MCAAGHVPQLSCVLLCCCRWGKKAGTLQGHKLDHITVGSRTSCYVPALQKLVGR